MKDLTNDQRSSRAKDVALWALQILTAAAFLMAGLGALSGQPMMVETFDKIGIGQWFRYVTGSIEVASAILLLIPRLTPVGAALLVCTMIGAVLTHLVIGGSPVPAPSNRFCQWTLVSDRVKSPRIMRIHIIWRRKCSMVANYPCCCAPRTSGCTASPTLTLRRTA